ncbi:MAG: hypothetical protein ABJA67_03910 [Chthonomonadales bacterium]
MKAKWLVPAVLVLVLATGGQAQTPLLGADKFPQLRGLNGLSGSGFGVDSDGHLSLSGATSFSTPVANVLGHGHVHVNYGGILAGTNPFTITRKSTNNTATGAFGMTVGAYNILVSDNVLSERLDQAFQVQVQVPLPTAKNMTLSFGALDVGGGAGSSGDGILNDARSSRSLFGVVTWKFAPSDYDPNINADRYHPMYVSVGGGTRRFANGFASISYQIARRYRTWAEYDGFGGNVGLTYATQVGLGGKKIELNALAGLVNGRYLTLGIGGGF